MLFSSLALTSAPFSIKNLTTSKLPLEEAIINAVIPIFVVTLTLTLALPPS
jgi:hypothetical protein